MLLNTSFIFAFYVRSRSSICFSCLILSLSNYIFPHYLIRVVKIFKEKRNSYIFVSGDGKYNIFWFNVDKKKTV